MRRAPGIAIAVAIALGVALVAVFAWRRPRPAAEVGSAGAPTHSSPSAPGHSPPASAPAGHVAASPLPLRDGGAGRVAVVLRAGWGSGSGQLGRRADPESVTEGPMSFLAGHGGLVILDNVNQRLVRLDAQGRPLRPIALPNAAAQDLARGAGDHVAVLDRLRAGAVTLFDGDGRTIGSALLAGPGISEPAAVTGIFGSSDGAIVAESEHGAWRDLLDAGGSILATRPVVPGRPTRDGGYVSAALVDRAAGSVIVHRFAADGSPRWDRVVGFGAPLLFIALVDADASGRVFIAGHTARESPAPPYALVDERLHVAAIDDDGRVLPAQLDVDAPPPREEAFRDLSVGDDGTIYWMRRTPDGVVIEAYRL